MYVKDGSTEKVQLQLSYLQMMTMHYGTRQREGIGEHQATSGLYLQAYCPTPGEGSRIARTLGHGAGGALAVPAHRGLKHPLSDVDVLRRLLGRLVDLPHHRLEQLPGTALV